MNNNPIKRKPLEIKKNIIFVADTFEGKKDKWLGAFEDILIDIMQEKTKKGLAFVSDTQQVKKAMEELLTEVEYMRSK